MTCAPEPTHRSLFDGAIEEYEPGKGEKQEAPYWKGEKDGRVKEEGNGLPGLAPAW